MHLVTSKLARPTKFEPRSGFASGANTVDSSAAGDDAAAAKDESNVDVSSLRTPSRSPDRSARSYERQLARLRGDDEGNPLQSYVPAPTLTTDDREFLQQTYKIRREYGAHSTNAAARRPPLQHERRPRSVSGLPVDAERYYLTLDDHRRYARDLARELGL
jgi:hypothetical protein